MGEISPGVNTLWGNFPPDAKLCLARHHKANGRGPFDLDIFHVRGVERAERVTTGLATLRQHLEERPAVQCADRAVAVQVGGKDAVMVAINIDYVAVLILREH